MKQIAIIALLTFVVLISCFGQRNSKKKLQKNDTTFPSLKILKEPRFLFNIHTGYSKGLGSSFKFYPDEIRVINIFKQGNAPEQKDVIYRNPWKGLGDGLRIGGGLSFIANDFINIGIDVDYFKSTINKLRDSSNRQISASPQPGKVDDYSYQENSSLSYDATLLTFTPNITFKAISKSKWFIYNKLGLVATFRPNSVETDAKAITVRQGSQGVYRDSSSAEVKKYDWKIKNPAVGFMGAFGIQVKIARRLRAFGEVQFSHIVFIVSKKTLTEFVVNGKDIANTLPMSMRELYFVKTFNTSTSNFNPNIPSQTLEQKIPISYAGGQLGLAVQF